MVGGYTMHSSRHYVSMTMVAEIHHMGAKSSAPASQWQWRCWAERPRRESRIPGERRVSRVHLVADPLQYGKSNPKNTVSHPVQEEFLHPKIRMICPGNLPSSCDSYDTKSYALGSKSWPWVLIAGPTWSSKEAWRYCDNGRFSAPSWKQWRALDGC